MSTLAYFGLTLRGDGTWVTGDGGETTWNSQAFTDLINNAHNAGDRVVVTAKSFSDSDICGIVANPTNAQRAIDNIIGAVQYRGLDGVNIDFEGTTTNAPCANIQQAFTAWVSSLSRQIHGRIPGSQLTVDAYSGSASWSGGFMRIDTLAPHVDAFFIMAYDMGLSNAASGQPGTLPNAPLAGPYTYTDTTSVDQFVAKSGSGNKVILGVPYYGYKFSTTGTNFNSPISATCDGSSYACADTYAGIISDFRCAQQLGISWDSPSSTPWASWYSPATGDPCGGNHGTYRELYYDNVDSLGAKYDLVNNRGIRGVGMWALGYDHPYADLWQLITAKFQGQPPLPPPTSVSYFNWYDRAGPGMYNDTIHIVNPGNTSATVARSCCRAWTTSRLASGRAPRASTPGHLEPSVARLRSRSRRDRLSWPLSGLSTTAPSAKSPRQQRRSRLRLCGSTGTITLARG